MCKSILLTLSIIFLYTFLPELYKNPSSLLTHGSGDVAILMFLALLISLCVYGLEEAVYFFIKKYISINKFIRLAIKTAISFYIYYTIVNWICLVVSAT